MYIQSCDFVAKFREKIASWYHTISDQYVFISVVIMIYIGYGTLAKSHIGAPLI